MEILSRLVLLVIYLNYSFARTQEISLGPTTQSILATSDNDNEPPIIFPSDATKLHSTYKKIINEAPEIFPSGPSSTPKGKRSDYNMPPEIFPTDPSVLDMPTDPSKTHLIVIPPLLFPLDTNTASNETALKILREHTDLKGKEQIPVVAVNPKNDAEEIQPKDTAKPKVELEEQYHAPATNLKMDDVKDDTVVDHPKFHHGHIMGIIAGVMAILCLGAFAGLLIWKKYLEGRYGKRERLVNEDDTDERNPYFEQI